MTDVVEVAVTTITVSVDAGTVDVVEVKTPGPQGTPGNDGADGADGADGNPGAPGNDGADGADGDDGWSPVFALVEGSNPADPLALYLSDWTGGTGVKPVTGQYVGAYGLTPNYGEAVNLRGAPGNDGDPGTSGNDGADGADGATILIGAAAPDNGDGNNGDVFIRTTGEWYKKAAGVWEYQGNLTGPQGEQGLPGTIPFAPDWDGMTREVFFTDYLFDRTLASVPGFSVTSSGSGSSSSAGVSNQPGHPGIVQLETGTTATGHTRIYSSGTAMIDFADSNALVNASVKSTIKITTPPDVTEDYAIFIGFHQSLTINPGLGTTDCVGIVLTSASPNFRIITFGDAATYVDTGVEATADTWFDIEVEVLGAASVNDVVVNAYINGVLVATKTGGVDLGAHSFMPVGIYKIAGTTERTVLVDRWRCAVERAAL